MLRLRKESSSRSRAERSSPWLPESFRTSGTRFMASGRRPVGERMDWHSFVSYLRRRGRGGVTGDALLFARFFSPCLVHRRRQARAGMPEEPIAEAANMTKAAGRLSHADQRF